MNETTLPKRGDRLDAYAQMLEERLAKMRVSGRLTRGYSTLNNEIEERQRLLRNRVTDAIRTGKFWDIVLAELRRDYSSLFDNILGFERTVDLEFGLNASARTTPDQDPAGSARK